MKAPVVSTHAASVKSVANSWVSRAEMSTGVGRLPVFRGRRVPYLVLGVLLVLVCAMGFAVAVTRLDHRHGALALARPVTVGQVLTGSDIRQVNIVADTGMSMIPAGQQAEVIGQTMALSLPAGALLTADEFGQAATPAAGRAMVAELLKPGQFPPDLAAGAHALLIPVAAAGSTTASPSTSGPLFTWPATVVGVQPLDTGEGSVVTLQVAQAVAVQVVTAGTLDLVVVAAGDH